LAILVARVVAEGVVQVTVSEGFLLEVAATAPQVAEPGVFSVVVAAALSLLSLLCKLAVSAASSSNTSSPKGATK
jgi:hypothetical protein